MKEHEVQRDRIDIAIIVPKEDELRALEWAFGQHFMRSTGKLSGGELYYKFEQSLKTESGISNIFIAVVFLNDQGNSITSSVTAEVYSKLDPILIFLIGTAAGREGKVKIGDVVVSNLVDDVQEWRIEKSATTLRRMQHIPPEKIRVDVGRFVGKDLSLNELRNKLLNMPMGLYDEGKPPNELWEDPPKIHIKSIASGPNLQLDPDKLKEIWNLDDRIRCYEMEGAGFATACKRYLAWQWLIVRSVSDYGTTDSKKEEYRVAAAASAAIFLQMFIEKGLAECHPHWLRVPESEEYTLPPESTYSRIAREDVISAIKAGIKNEIDIDLVGIDLDRSLSIVDLESVCESRGADKTKAYHILSSIRKDYFTKKYINYTYEDDLRGLVPNWANEIKDILSKYSIDLKSSTVVDVGIGDGLEAPYLLTDVAELIGVDISEDMLTKAKQRFSTLKTIHNSAEDLHEIATSTIDVYISLRTYQSSLFDVPSALREAQRVLKQRGFIIISIANGFVKLEGGEKKLVRGLLFPGSRDIVDKSAPMDFAKQIWKKLTDLGFESVGLNSEKTDVYVWGRKP